VGSELLLGQIIDTNAAFIGRQLARAGIDVLRKQTVGDNLDRITDCIRGALSRADAVVITGGLGPTNDDLTREAIANYLEAPLELQPKLEKDLRDFFERRGIPIAEINLRQAYLPRGASEIPNPVGTAPGVFAEDRQGHLIFAVPGVPKEMIAMIDGSVVPALLERSEGERNIIVSRTLRTFGIGESSLAEPVEDILTTSENPTVAPLIYQNTEVHLRLTAKARDEAEAKVLLDDMEARIRERSIAPHIFGIDDQTLPSILVQLLTERGQSVAVAESLTGGQLHSFLTDIPGASKVLRGGVVAYTEAVKQQVLGVPAELIAQHSVVSAEVALAMAGGVRELTGADWALSTTGEAGPTPATNAGVGTAFIGLCGPNGVSETFEREFFGDRELVKKRTSLYAVDMLRRHLSTA
jgi:nicotinamide-nucleotide amidase